MKPDLQWGWSGRSTGMQIAAVLLLGAIVRGLFLTHPGYEPDIAFWKSYLSYSTVFGIEHVYSLETDLQPYPPVLLYILWGLGRVYTGLLGLTHDTPLLTAFVKLPAVLGDLTAALLLAFHAKRWKGERTLPPIVAASVLALNPVLIWLSGFWGQCDILHGLMTAAAWGAALAGSAWLAGCLAAIGVLTKPQGLIVLPALAALILARSGVRGLLRAVATGCVAVIVVILPFVVAGHGEHLVRIYTGASEKYPYLSVNGFNPWWIAASAMGGGWGSDLIRDDTSLIGPLTPKLIGLLLFVLATAWITWRSYLVGRTAGPGSDRSWRILTLQWFAFFLLPTQIHERYLVPALVSLAVAFTLNRGLWWLYGLLLVSIFLNVVSVFPGSTTVLQVARTISGRGVLVALALVLAGGFLLRAELRETGGAKR